LRKEPQSWLNISIKVKTIEIYDTVKYFNMLKYMSDEADANLFAVAECKVADDPHERIRNAFVNLYPGMTYKNK
jgi:hypothetical protein